MPEKSRLVLAGGPKQLRSEDYPSGLPHLEGRDLERVQLANALYSGLTRFLTQCTLQDIPWSVENPTSSYLWLIPCFVNLIADTPCRFYKYDTCAWGSTRKLHRSFLSTLPEMCGIQALCPGNHEHAPFGRTRQSDGTFKYATSDEAAYTKQLCVQVVSIVQNALQLFPQKFEADPNNVAVNHKGMIAMHKQPAGRRMPPLISEFERFAIVTAASMPHNRCQRLLDGLPSTCSQWLKAAQFFEKGGTREQLSFEVWYLQNSHEVD